MHTTTRDELLQACDALLQPARFKDYGPNGLQVEGKAPIRRLVSGVTASRALIEAAIAEGADAIFVHHGLFWRGQSGTVTGWMKQRLALLLAHDISLLAYHLPLDAHPELGNNAQLGRVLGLTPTGVAGDQGLLWLGETAQPVPASVLAQQVGAALGREALLVGDTARSVRRVAWCTGGAQGYFEQAIAEGVDLYLSGEISEQTTHLARESGVPYIAAGHHATERYGVRALGAHVAAQFGLQVDFVDIDNPA